MLKLKYHRIFDFGSKCMCMWFELLHLVISSFWNFKTPFFFLQLHSLIMKNYKFCTFWTFFFNKTNKTFHMWALKKYTSNQLDETALFKLYPGNFRGVGDFKPHNSDGFQSKSIYSVVHKKSWQPLFASQPSSNLWSSQTTCSHWNHSAVETSIRVQTGEDSYNSWIEGNNCWHYLVDVIAQTKMV